MENPAYLFLIIAAVIVVLALILSRMFRNSQKSNDPNDPNGNRADGDAIATWSGIEHSGDDD